ncbi:hypothetical protein ACJMK2_004252 [Sinanodonta woodiana]|uniref:Uncharacterized protein n=1 Tax=Sinanodonta woodiana TaxID=1069815 RepID=A0ABD3Y311_SINWO
MGPHACLIIWAILHCIVEYKGVSAIRCYRCNCDVPCGNRDSSCINNPVSQQDCPMSATTCFVTKTLSGVNQDVQSVKQGCGSGDIVCSGSCSDCKSDICYTVCKDDLCNVFDAHTNGIGARWQSTEAMSMLTLSMLITFGIRLLSKCVL